MALYRKKICFIAASPISVSEFLGNHINSLSLNYDIYVVTNFKVPFKLNLNHSVNYYHIPIERKPSLVKDILCLFPLIKYLISNQFESVHTIDPKAGFIGNLCAYIAAVPIRIHIFTGQAWHTKKGFVKSILMSFDKLIVKLASHILVDGKSQLDFLIYHKIIKNSGASVLGDGSISGVDKNKFISNIQVRESLRGQYGLQKDTIVYAFMGRLNEDKGVLDLASAFYRFNQKYPNSTLFFIGSDEENIESKIRLRFPSSQIRFTGYSKVPFHTLQLADVFCFPSYREGFGTSVIEASMLQIPIICSDTYGLRDTIIDGVTGLRHRVGDIDDIFDKMEELYKNEDLRSYLGRNGNEYVTKKFDSKRLTKLWIDFYKQILNQ